MPTFEEMLKNQGPAFSGAGRLSMAGEQGSDPRLMEQESDPRASFGTLMEQQGSVFSGSLQPGRLSIAGGGQGTEPVEKPETEVGSGGGKAWMPTVTFLNLVDGKKKGDYKYRFQIKYSQGSQEQIDINVNQVRKLGQEVLRNKPEAHEKGVGDHLKNIKNNLKPEQLEIVTNKISILYYLRGVLNYFYANGNVQAFKGLLTQAVSSQGGGKRKRTKKRKTKKRKTKKRTKRKTKKRKRTKRN